MVTADDANGKIRIQGQHILSDSGTTEPGAVLVERSGPLVALALYPIAGRGADVVDALFGPGDEKGQMTFHRLPIDGGAPISEWTFTVPDDPEKINPSAWAITSQPLPDPVIIARLRDRLLVRRASSGSKWSILAEKASRAEYLRLEAIGNQAIWAIWADPALGIQYKHL